MDSDKATGMVSGIRRQGRPGSRLGRITRRTLLVGAVALGGGAAFGIWQVRRPVTNPLAPDSGATLNPYLIIDGDDITIITPRAEMGQGIHTTLAALVAEELDIDWTQVRHWHGPPAPAYFNGALMHGAIPGAEYARPDWQIALAEVLGEASKVLGLQVTGGSTSTVDAYDRMRLAGAGAREALKAVAADRLGVDVAALSTEGGHVIGPDGARIAYGDLAAEAAERPVPQPALRDPSEWRLLGRALPRLDMVEKVTGTAAFGTDIKLDGLKCATLRLCPYPGGGMTGFDPQPALAVPGVEHVIDLGDGIGVVARNTWAAMQGAEALEVDWTRGDVPDSTGAMFDRITQAFDGRRNSRMRNDGDVERGASEHAHRVTAEYRVPFLHHMTMEPMSATALMADGHLTVWCGNQAPRLHVDRAAAAAGIDAENVTLHTTYMGGGFGRRAESDFTHYAAKLAAALPGVPIRLTYSRAQDTAHGFLRPAAVARMDASLSGGWPLTLTARVAAPSVSHQAIARMTGRRMGGPDRGHVEGLFDQPYAIENYRVEGYLADLDVPVGFWRAVGNSQNAFFHESFIDELAHEAGADPLEFRLHLIREAHRPSAQVLEAVAEMSDWGNPPEGRAHGVAFCHSFGTPVAQVVEVGRDGGALRITRAWIACDPGRVLDPGIVRAQMESGLIFGLSAAISGAITFEGGRVQERNFPDADPLRMHNSPEIAVRILEDNPHMGGVGEPGTPPAAPALANAVFALTGERVRELPLNRHLDFLT